MRNRRKFNTAQNFPGQHDFASGNRFQIRGVKASILPFHLVHE